MTQQASIVVAGAGLVLVVVWFVAKAVIGHVAAHWIFKKISNRRKKPDGRSR